MKFTDHNGTVRVDTSEGKTLGDIEVLEIKGHKVPTFFPLKGVGIDAVQIIAIADKLVIMGEE